MRPEPQRFAKSAAQKHSLRYREIPVGPMLANDLTLASQRNNLTFVVADPQTLTVADYRPVNSFDTLPQFHGTSLLMLWDHRRPRQSVWRQARYGQQNPRSCSCG